MGKIHFKNKQHENTDLKKVELEEQVSIEKDCKKTAKEKIKGKGDKEVKVLYEDISRRGRNVKHFKRDDGTYQAVIYPRPVHYLDEKEGKFMPIDNRFIAQLKADDDNEDFEGYCNKSGEVKVKFAKNIHEKNLLTIKKGQHQLIWALLGKKQREEYQKQVKGAEGKVIESRGKEARAEAFAMQKSEIIYNDCFEGADLQYFFEATYLKDNIIVKEKSDTYEYAFKLKVKNLNVALAEDEKTLEFYIERINEETGGFEKLVQFTIPTPFMTDKNGTRSEEVSYDLEDGEFADEYIFKITADADWINAEERVLPVVIDPMVKFNYPKEGDNSSVAVCLSNKHKAQSNDNNLLFVGRSENYGECINRSYFWFDLSKIPTTNTFIQIARLYLMYYGSSVSNSDQAKKYGAYKITENDSILSPWYRKKVSEFKWATQPNFEETPFAEMPYENELLSGDAVEIDLTNVVRDWINEPGSNQGFLLKDLTEDEGIQRYIEFSSLDIIQDVDGLEERLGLYIIYQDKDNMFSQYQQSNQVNRAGTGMVDLYSRNFRFVHEDVTRESETLPLQVFHLFNKNWFDSPNGIKLPNGLNLETSVRTIGMGRGWKTNMHQYLLPYNRASLEDEMSEENAQYIYVNAMGEFIILTKEGDKIENKEKGLTFDYVSPYYQLTDKQGNVLKFTEEGFLKRIEDAYGNYHIINYNIYGSILGIYNSALGTINFEYGTIIDGKTGAVTSSQGLLSKISWAKNNQYMDFDYFGDKLDKITYKDDNKTEFSYTGGAYLVGFCVKDQTGYQLDYTFNGSSIEVEETANALKISSAGITQGSSAGGKITISYLSDYKTQVTTQDGNSVYYNFDVSGGCYSKYAQTGGDEPKLLGMQFTSTTSKVEEIEEENEEGHKQERVTVTIFSYTKEVNQTNYAPISAKKNISSEVSVGTSEETALTGNSYVVSALAMANSMLLSETVKFRLGAKIHYTDGSSEEAEYTDCNYMEKDWQAVAVGVSKSNENRDKAINKIEMIFDYSGNSGTADFENICLVESRYNKQQIVAIQDVDETENETQADRSTTLITEDGSGNQVITTLNEKQQPTSVTQYDRWGGVYPTAYTWNGSNEYELASRQDFRGIITENTYNNKGNLLKVKSYMQGFSSAFITEREYTSDGTKLVREYDQRGGTDYDINYSYDSYGRLVSMIEPNDKTTTYTYNTNHELATINNGSVTQSFGYTKGLLTQISSWDASLNIGDMYNFEYDGFGVMTRVIVNGNYYYSKSYKNTCNYEEAHGEEDYNYEEVTYGNGASIKSIVNEKGELVSVVSRERVEVNGQWQTETGELLRLTYDTQGRLQKIEDKGFRDENQNVTTEGYSLEYNYNPDGSVKGMAMGGLRTMVLFYERDLDGRLIEETVQINEEKKYQYEYEKLGESVTPDNRLIRMKMPDNKTITYNYDNLGRVSGIHTQATSAQTTVVDGTGSTEGIMVNGARTFTESYQYLNVETRTTGMVSRATYSWNEGYEEVNYAYDARGNIASIIKDGKKTTYAYDELNRLVREDNQALGFTKKYTYDNFGNIMQQEKYAYTEASATPTGVLETITYTYNAESAGNNGKRLTLIAKTSSPETSTTNFSYDSAGNACNYRGNVIEWRRGKNMTSYGPANGVKNRYKYDASGIRQEKITAAGVVHRYWLEGDRIHRETRNNATELWYYYDATGLQGFTYNGTRYHYQKNLQGDIVRILDEYANLVAYYEYDAWGNHKVYDSNHNENATATFIGNINPFRYRGYYYDVETGLYYLNSRYYDPKYGRFINADDISYIQPAELNGINLYSYCNNNPVMYVDPSGHKWWEFWKWDWASIGKIALGVAGVVGLAVASVFTGGAASVMFAGAAIGAGAGFVGGGISGVVSSGGLAGFANGALLGSITGAISGAVAASSLWVGGQVAINAMLNIGQYAIPKLINKESIDIGELIFQGVVGGFSGLIGGNGAMRIGANLVDEISKRYLVKYGIGFMQKVFYPIIKASLVNSTIPILRDIIN